MDILDFFSGRLGDDLDAALLELAFVQELDLGAPPLEEQREDLQEILVHFRESGQELGLALFIDLADGLVGGVDGLAEVVPLPDQKVIALLSSGVFLFGHKVDRLDPLQVFLGLGELVFDLGVGKLDLRLFAFYFMQGFFEVLPAGFLQVDHVPVDLGLGDLPLDPVFFFPLQLFPCFGEPLVQRLGLGPLQEKIGLLPGDIGLPVSSFVVLGFQPRIDGGGGFPGLGFFPPGGLGLFAERGDLPAEGLLALPDLAYLAAQVPEPFLEKNDIGPEFDRPLFLLDRPPPMGGKFLFLVFQAGFLGQLVRLETRDLLPEFFP